MTKTSDPKLSYRILKRGGYSLVGCGRVVFSSKYFEDCVAFAAGWYGCERDVAKRRLRGF